MSITFADVAELLREHPHYVYANLLIADFDFASAGTTPLEFRAAGRVLRVRVQRPDAWQPCVSRGHEQADGLVGFGFALLQGSPVGAPSANRVFPVRFDVAARSWAPYTGVFLPAMKKYLA